MDFFHVLNRGVDKRTTFLDERDYLRFIHDIYEFNDTRNVLPYYQLRRATEPSADVRRPQTYHERSRERLVQVHFFCLMPNHYHLLLSPVVENGISLFMKKLNGGYSKYFNEKYDRSGALWQGKYKKVLIERDAHFLYIPYYIHFNPLDLKVPEWRKQCIAHPKKALDFLNTYRWSSHLDYLGEKNFPLVTDRKFFLEFFGGEGGYKKSVSKTLKEFSVDEVAGVTLE